jgi:hypothetical protein
MACGRSDAPWPAAPPASAPLPPAPRIRRVVADRRRYSGGLRWGSAGACCEAIVWCEGARCTWRAAWTKCLLNH